MAKPSNLWGLVNVFDLRTLLEPDGASILFIFVFLSVATVPMAKWVADPGLYLARASRGLPAIY